VLLRDRLLSAAILIAAVAGLLWLEHQHPLRGVTGLWLLPLLMFFALGTALDVIRLINASGRRIDGYAVLVATAILPLAAYIPSLWPLLGQSYPVDCPLGRSGWIVAAAVTAIFIVLIREVVTYDAFLRGEAIERTFNGIFVSCYVGIPMAVLVAVVNLGSGQWGIAALISTIAVTKSSDTGAYFTGRLFGRNKLIPQLSPGKTWEGAIGGVIASVLVSYGCFFYLIPQLAAVRQSPPVWGAIVFGVACAVAGMFGDLAESLVKRETGMKDSGTTLPGLGGVWDVSDSLIAAVVPAWLALAAGLAGSS
jgi:phosphatidate cytidylyltransferase